ncbi:hypothetical protein BH10ACT10_BH10ACT10_15500 [soil metagenome]
MLVLSRRVGESLVIGDDIVITTLEQRGDIVRVGVGAPRHIQVSRQELLVEIERTNRAAVSPSADVVAELSKRVSPPSTDGGQPSAGEERTPETP